MDICAHVLSNVVDYVTAISSLSEPSPVLRTSSTLDFWQWDPFMLAGY